jgi:hypothetical protein
LTDIETEIINELLVNFGKSKNSKQHKEFGAAFTKRILSFPILQRGEYLGKIDLLIANIDTAKGRSELITHFEECERIVQVERDAKRRRKRDHHMLSVASWEHHYLEDSGRDNCPLRRTVSFSDAIATFDYR